MLRQSTTPLVSALRSRAILTRSFATPPPPQVPEPKTPKTTLPPNPSGAPAPGTGQSMALPTAVAVAGGLGAYLFFKEKDQQVTGGDITKGPKDGQPSRMAG